MYSPAGMAGPLLYAASSTMLGLAWKAVTFIPSRSLSSTSSSSLRHSSKSPDQSQKSLQHAIDTPSRRSPSHMELRVSTTCACGLKVSLEVPKWISDSVDIAQNSSCDGSCNRGGHGNQANQAGEVRNLVVEGVVGFAQAVRSSPLLPVIFAAVKAFVAFVVYLDARFLLREHAAHAVTELATGLVEIEKELGLMRNAGEGLSIGWEALVKGVIALARSDPPSTVRATQPEFSSTSFSTNKVQPYSRFDSFDQPGYRDEPISPTYSSSPRYPSYLTTDADESGPSTLTPSSPIGTHLSAPTYAPPLRRAPLSSPVLRTLYLSSGTSTPSQGFHEARPAPSGSSPDSYRPPSYSHEYSSPFESDPSSHLHRRSRSGPDVPSSQQSPQEGTGSSWPTRTMLGWADRLMTKADTLQQYHR